MKKKSNKLAKLEKNRYSVFTDNLNKCYECGSNYQMTKHEIFGGRNRQNSMIYGYVLPLCYCCHCKKQHDKEFNDYWHKKAQEHFELNQSRNEFIKIFGRNYL